jgi:tetratricopeptide (TPR) repeat protein
VPANLRTRRSVKQYRSVSEARRLPKNPRAHLSRADANIAQGKFKAADEDLDPILKADPNNFTANYLRAVELAAQQQYAAADQIFDRISPAFPTFWTGFYLAALEQLFESRRSAAYRAESRIDSSLANGRYRVGFRMPAWRERSTRSEGAGVRKPPKKEPAGSR